MIVFNRQSWIRQVLTFRGAPLSIIWIRVTVATALAVAVTLADQHWPAFEINLSPLPFSLIGVALGIFLGFRNNTGYDRFWEGRKLWGRQVNQARSFARQILCYISAPDANTDAKALRSVQVELVYRVIAFTHSLRLHLRGERDMDKLRTLLPDEEVSALEGQRNVPLALSQVLGQRVGDLCRDGWIDRYHLSIFETSITEMTTVQGACERIRNTPIPASYSILLHRIVLVYCLGLPFGIVATLGAHTPLVVAIVAYAFYGLDAAGVEVEEPFGHQPNDLPLNALCTTIEINLRQQLGETEIPDDPVPVDSILN